MNKYLSDYFQIVQNQLEFPVNLNLLVPINSGQDWALKEDRAPTSTLCENNATLWFSCAGNSSAQTRRGLCLSPAIPLMRLIVALIFWGVLQLWLSSGENIAYGRWRQEIHLLQE